MGTYKDTGKFLTDEMGTYKGTGKPIISYRNGYVGFKSSLENTDNIKYLSRQI